MTPSPIGFAEAIGVAGLGLVVNIACAWILGGVHDHRHDDLNLRSAHLHVVADAATSVLALIALGACKLFGWNWLDPVMGIAGAGLIAIWAHGLLKDAAKILVDAGPGPSHTPSPPKPGGFA